MKGKKGEGKRRIDGWIDEERGMEYREGGWNKN